MTTVPTSSIRGSYYIPDVGEVVWILFEGGDLDSPIYLGGSIGTSDISVDRNIATFYKEGDAGITYNRISKELILSIGNSRIVMKEGNINIDATTSISLNAPDIKIAGEVLKLDSADILMTETSNSGAETTTNLLRNNGSNIAASSINSEIFSDQSLEGIPSEYAGGEYRWPVPGFTYISSSYGPRPNIGSGYHHGIDIAGTGIEGALIIAPKAGTVTKVVTGYTYSTWKAGPVVYGNYIVINHGGGWESTYAHLQRVNVSVGDSVVEGAIIGAVGTTGYSSGPHLHFEIRQSGSSINPVTLLSS